MESKYDYMAGLNALKVLASFLSAWNKSRSYGTLAERD